MLTQSLWTSWLRLLTQALKATQQSVDRSAASAAFAELVAAYSRRDRHYHTLHHVQHMLCVVEQLKDYAQDITAVNLAAWFHDVVYDTQAQDNEEKSADFAAQALQSLGFSPATIASVTRLILNTKHHQADADDLDTQVLLDADLAILGASSRRYWAYADAIRREYSWVPEASYLQGRKRVLEQFLQRDRLYLTPAMVEKREAAARRNLQAEVQSLIARSPLARSFSEVKPLC